MEKDSFILKSFKIFIKENKLVEEDSIELLIDSTVGSYIVNTIYQFYQEYENHKTWLDDNAEQEFDKENFSEIVEAYLPGFSQIDKNLICKWLVNLKQEIDHIDPENKADKVEIFEHCQENAPVTETNQTSQLDPEIQTLVEMFPNVCINEISKIFKRHHKNQTKAIEQLLTIQNSQIVSKDDDLTEEQRKYIKEKTLQKFGLVQVNEDGSPIESKPRFTWNEEKKLNRYYESKIVSTKGEKLFEYKTEKDEELEKQMKKTYINLKPARKYRFH